MNCKICNNEFEKSKQYCPNCGSKNRSEYEKMSFSDYFKNSFNYWKKFKVRGLLFTLFIILLSVFIILIGLSDWVEPIYWFTTSIIFIILLIQSLGLLIIKIREIKTLILPSLNILTLLIILLWLFFKYVFFNLGIVYIHAILIFLILGSPLFSVSLNNMIDRGNPFFLSLKNSLIIYKKNFKHIFILELLSILVIIASCFLFIIPTLFFLPIISLVWLALYEQLYGTVKKL